MLQYYVNLSHVALLLPVFLTTLIGYNLTLRNKTFIHSFGRESWMEEAVCRTRHTWEDYIEMDIKEIAVEY
jgi:hypothetical protein